MNGKASAIIGAIVIALVGGSIFLAKRLLPSLFKIILGLGIGAIAIMALLLIVGLVFAFKSSSDD